MEQSENCNPPTPSFFHGELTFSLWIIGRLFSWQNVITRIHFTMGLLNISWPINNHFIIWYCADRNSVIDLIVKTFFLCGLTFLHCHHSPSNLPGVSCQSSMTGLGSSCSVLCSYRCWKYSVRHIYFNILTFPSI